MSIMDDFAKKARFRLIEYDDKYSRFIKFHETWDIIERDFLIQKLKTGRMALRYINEGERLEV